MRLKPLILSVLFFPIHSFAGEARHRGLRTEGHAWQRQRRMQLRSEELDQELKEALAACEVPMILPRGTVSFRPSREDGMMRPFGAQGSKSHR